jgi:hypothetical protein
VLLRSSLARRGLGRCLTLWRRFAFRSCRACLRLWRCLSLRLGRFLALWLRSCFAGLLLWSHLALRWRSSLSRGHLALRLRSHLSLRLRSYFSLRSRFVGLWLWRGVALR